MHLRMLCNMIEQLQLLIWCNVRTPCRPIPDAIYGFHIGHSPRTQQLPALAVIAPAVSSQTAAINGPKSRQTEILCMLIGLLAHFSLAHSHSLLGN